jgi:choline dehydrogenase
VAIEDGARFDFVIVGAGSAGCVLANRLSADPNIKVALIEAGGRDNSMLIRMPAGSGSILPSRGPLNWGFDSAPQERLEGRRLYQPRGRGWGGTSSINGMIYIRGHARDYDHWRQMGLAGWGYRDVLPYFKRAESNDRGADPWHGDAGPLFVSSSRRSSPLYQAFVQAGVAAGYPLTKDFNGWRQEGVGLYQFTIRDGERASASASYLHPIVGVRSNFAIVSKAHAAKALIEDGRAVGIEYERGRRRNVLYADREVILCAGAFQSPQLLMLSGVGPAQELRKHGVAVLADAPDVGRNLQDHFDVGLVWNCTKPITVYSMTKGWRRLKVGLDYMIARKGPGRVNHLEAGGFVKTRGELDRPDIQLHYFDANFFDHARVRPDRDGFAVHACQLRPESRGEVRLNSPDPFVDPLIDPNYLATETDKRTMRDAVRITRRIVEQDALRTYRGAEVRPGPDVRTDSEVDAWIRQTGETIYHPVGTCRMGADPKSVVDAELRVRGVAGLRVVDASVMPALVGGNTNAPTIMIAEKASDMILGKPALAPEDAPIAEDALAEAV